MNRSLSVLLPFLILLAGLSLRVAYLEEVRHSPEFRYPLYDPEYNAYWAKGLATGDWTPPPGVRDPEIRTTPHGRPPGYPWFLALIYKLFGANDLSPRVVQMLLGLVNALLLYSLGLRLFNRPVAFIAGLMMALYWVFPYYEALLTYPALAIFLLLSLFHCLHFWAQKLHHRWLVPSGMLLGAFALLRPNGLLLLPLLLLWLFWTGRRRAMTLPRLVPVLAVPLLTCALILAPPFIRNYRVARDVVFLSSYGGINLYVGNHPEASLVEPRIPELKTWAGVENWSCFDYPAIVRGLAAQEGAASLKFSEANRYFYQKALGFIVEKPGLFCLNLIKKTLLFWGPLEITNDTVPAWDKHFSPVLRFLPGFPWVFALFLVGSLTWIFKGAGLKKEKQEAALFLWLAIPVYCLSVIIYFVAGRYRVPIIPLLLLFGAQGLVEFFSAVQSRQVKKILLLSLAFLIALLMAHFHLPGYEASEATWHLRQALACNRSGRSAEAEEAYWKALEKGADSSIVYANLGRIHVQRGDRERGIALYRRGLEEHPGNAILENNLGYELYRDGYRDEARERYERAIANSPRLALARINLGHLLADEGALEEALQHYEEALRLEPGDYAAAYNTARMYFALGQITQAAHHYEEAVVLRPDAVEAWNNLGYCHAVQGAWKKAIHCYETALEILPSYALAWNNLGNAHLALGETDAARRAYEQALAGAPEEEGALYNLARLSIQQGDQEAGEAFLKECLSVNPHHEAARNLLSTLQSNSPEAE